MDFVNPSPPKLSHVNDDVDLDELDFEVLPWLMKFEEFKIKEDPDPDPDPENANLRNSIGTNNNDRENKDKSRIESNQRKNLFQCDVCFKTLARKTSLKLHKRIHTGEKHFECDVCFKKFAVKNYLNVAIYLSPLKRIKRNSCSG